MNRLVSGILRPQLRHISSKSTLLKVPRFENALRYTFQTRNIQIDPSGGKSGDSSGFHRFIDREDASRSLPKGLRVDANAANDCFSKGVCDEATRERASRDKASSQFVPRLVSAVVSCLLVYVICGSWVAEGFKRTTESLKTSVSKDEKDTAGDRERKPPAASNPYSDQAGSESSPEGVKIKDTIQKPADDGRPRDSRGNVIKSKFHVHNTGVTFADIVGIGEERQELMDIVDFMREPERYTTLGAKLPKGVLLAGKPGVGKTLMAKAVANEADVPFFHIDGASIDGPYVGMGTAQIKKIFKDAKKHAPAIVFIDEIDAIGGKRTTSDKYPHARSTINTLLSEMDGFDKETPVVVLGSTNMAEILDEALTRAGRFDVKINVPAPLRSQRFELLQHYLAKVQTTVDVDVDEVARITGGMVPADFKNLASTAGRIAIQRGHIAVTQNDITEAHDELSMGVGLKETVKKLSKDCLENTAWHEAGHALCNYFMEKQGKRAKKNIDPWAPVHKITIIPRGRSGGHTAFLTNDGDPFEEDYYMRLCVAYGGYVGEEMYQGDGKISTGPGGDFQGATSIAKNMVMHGLYGHELGESSMRLLKDKYENLSEEEKEAIDKGIIAVCNKAYQYCKQLLETHRESMRCISEALVKYEQITAEEMEAIIVANSPEGGKHLRVEEDEEMNRRRFVKTKGIRLEDVPESIKEQNRKNLGKQ